MMLFVWACMWTSAFFPSAGLAALQTAATAVHSQMYTPSLSTARVQIEPQRARVSQPLMMLGWVAEEDAPIF